MDNINIYYRISDKGNPKAKLDNANKFLCLQNAINVFGRNSIFVIADNCSEETILYIKKNNLIYTETSLGNSASFIYTLDLIISKHNSNEYVYLLEDDYLHRNGSKQVLLEGLEIADYVTLYDNPDKYKFGKLANNPFNSKRIQKTKIYITKSSHWREVNSTTMTFACQVKTLQSDYKVWKKNCRDAIPADFASFVELTQNNFSDIFYYSPIRKNKKAFIALCINCIFFKNVRLLISPMPAYSTHAEFDYLSPLINWSEI